MALTLLQSDLEALRGGDWKVGAWLADALKSCAVRLLLRPGFMVFVRPGTLTPLIKQNVHYIAAGQPAYDAYRNNFVPFITSKAQFFGFFSYARSASALYRAVFALRARTAADEQRVNAFALGDIVGDSIELAMMQRRYGGSRRGVLLANALLALFHLRALLTGRLHSVGVALQLQQTLTRLLPLWWYIFTRQHRRARGAALVHVVGVTVAALRTAQLAGRLVESARTATHVESDLEVERHAALLLLGVTLVASAIHGAALVRFLLKTRKL